MTLLLLSSIEMRSRIHLRSIFLNSFRKYQTFDNCLQKTLLSSDNCIKFERKLSTNPIKSKTILKSESQIKLAQILSKCPIDSFPLLKSKDFDINDFQNEFKEFFEVLNVSEKNNLNNSLYYPSVTTILSATLSVQSLIALDKWKKLKITELGEQGFKEYQKNLLNRGKHLHLNIKNFIQTKDESTLTLSDSIDKLWKSLSPVLDQFDGVQLCETPLSHPFLCYKGIVDCVAHYSGKLVIIEWKTSEKLKPTLRDLYDNPLQAVAYLGAINYENQLSYSIHEIALVYAYEDGTTAQIHHLSEVQCQKYWKQWLSRVKNYWELIAFKQNVN